MTSRNIDHRERGLTAAATLTAISCRVIGRRAPAVTRRPHAARTPLLLWSVFPPRCSRPTTCDPTAATMDDPEGKEQLKTKLAAERADKESLQRKLEKARAK